MPYYQYPWGELIYSFLEHFQSHFFFKFSAAMMAGYAPYMYGMAGRSGYRARTRDYMPGW